MIRQLLGVAWVAGASARLLGNTPSEISTHDFTVPTVDQAGTKRFFPGAARRICDDLGAGISLQIALVPGGSFEMGSQTLADLFYPKEQPIHTVSIKPFGMGVFPVTRAHWGRVSGLPRVNRDLRPLHNAQTGDDLPADFVSKLEIQEFLSRLSLFTGRAYRLPSEAEWEYSCRAGTNSAYHFGDGIDRTVANYSDGLSPVFGLLAAGSLNAPNRFGLHDMHGNVMEWCADVENLNYIGAPNDGSAWITGADQRVNIVRGGGYYSGAFYVRSCLRWALPNVTASALGFRVAVTLDHGFTDPRIEPNRIRNGASFLPGSISPGQIFSIDAGSLGVVVSDIATPSKSQDVPIRLADVRVWLNGVNCPILRVHSGEVIAVAPYDLCKDAVAQIVVDAQGQSTKPVAIQVAESAPGLFTADQSGRGVVAAINEDGSAHSEGNPAARGSRLSLFGTGEGQTNPPGVNGKIANPGDGPIPVPVLPVTVRIGGVECEILYAGGEGGQVAGLFRVDVQVPAGLEKSGLWPVVLQVGESLSQDEAFVAVS